MEFDNRVAIITGGASGIGEATVREFASRRAAVAIVDRNLQAGERLAAEVSSRGSRAGFFPADVSNREDVGRVVEEIAGRFSGIDVLVNNAGIQRYGTVITTEEAMWDEVMSVNLKGAFLMSKFALPHMIRRGGGVVVNIGSVQSVTAVGNSVAYVTSKHGLLGLTRGMAVDHARDNIRVHCVCPGAIDTPLLRWAASQSADPQQVLETCERVHLIQRLGRPEEVARVIAFLASGEASFMTGNPIMVEGGLLAPTGGTSFQESGTGSGAR